jgi:hypothetical protein
MSELKWEEWRWGDWRCVDKNGRVVGRVHRSVYTGEFEANNECYVTLPQAQSAIERQTTPFLGDGGKENGNG